MKKIAIALLFSLTCTFLAQAQDGKFRFGMQTSPTFSWLSTDNKNINGNGPNLGFKLGLIGEYDIAENYSFTGGLNFAFNHGGTLKYNNGGTFWPSVTSDTLPDGVNLKYNLQYVEIPMGMKMRTNEFGLFRFYAELPIFTLGFVSKSTGAIKAAGDANREKENIRDEVKGFTVSWGFGVGTEYDLSSTTKLVGGLAFQKAFVDLTENSGKIGGTTTDDSKANMSAIALRIGVIF